jgi:hypothetical protein
VPEIAPNLWEGGIESDRTMEHLNGLAWESGATQADTVIREQIWGIRAQSECLRQIVLLLLKAIREATDHTKISEQLSGGNTLRQKLSIASLSSKKVAAGETSAGGLKARVVRRHGDVLIR